MNIIFKGVCLTATLLMGIGFAGCSSTAQPFVYHDDRQEKPGPGLFSGEDGGYIITTEPSEKDKPAKEKQVDLE